MQWLLIVVVLFVLAAFVFRPRERSRHEPQRVILSSPRVKNLSDTLAALSSLGLDISEPALLGTEVDLIRSVVLRLRSRAQDFGADFQELVKASGGLLTKADQVTLQVACSISSSPQPTCCRCSTLNLIPRMVNSTTQTKTTIGSPFSPQAKFRL